MKKLNFLFVFFVFGYLSSFSQDWSTTGNTTTGTEFLGTNSGSSNPNLTFRRAGLFAGQIGNTSISLGVDSWVLPSNTISKQNTMIGYQAGQNTSISSTPGVNGGNTYVGAFAGKGVSSSPGVGFNNVCVGNSSGENMINGSMNVFLGTDAGRFLSNSSSNVCIGFSAGSGSLNNTNGGNVIIGAQAGQGNQGNGNVFIGSLAGRATNGSSTTGIQNTFIGSNCGVNITTGSSNTLIGRITSSNPNLQQTIIIGDGAGIQKLYIDENGFTGIGLGNNEIPQNRLELNSIGAVANTLGLRFRNFTNTNFNSLTTDATPKVLSVNANGDVILVDDKQAINPAGTLSTTCNTANFITKSTGSTGNLTCSQIFDNGTSVGVGTTSNFGYTFSPGDFAAGTVQLSGTVTLDVAGVTRSTGFYATSDKKFKKDIQPIESALDKIMNLEGKTYNWRKDEFKDKNFTSELQYGLLAQDVQKVIPSLVIQSENGDLAMNYTGLIPVLIEALKEQQSQINELKQQLTDNFKAQNQDLLQFSNTKIVGVSPNPSNDVITVSINVEKEVQTAMLQVHDINGLVLSSLNLKERATNITKTLQKDNFGKGVYIVSLVINGKSIDTKKIVFN